VVFIYLFIYLFCGTEVWTLWFTTVILATWETEIGRIMVKIQPLEESLLDPITTSKNLGVVVSSCHPSYTGSVNINKRIKVQACLGINGETILKNH
jgi:ribosomal protein L31